MSIARKIKRGHYKVVYNSVTQSNQLVRAVRRYRKLFRSGVIDEQTSRPV